jgi:hypothetical protein
MKVQPTDIFYHGSKKSFIQFDESMSYKSKRRFVVGVFWFSSNEKVAKSYGKIIYRVNLKIENPFIVDAKGENFSEIYLNYLPPNMCLEIDRMDNRRPGDTFNTFIFGKKENPEFSLRFASCELAIASKSAGFDSMIICNAIDAGNKSVLNIRSNIFSVFNNTQITIQEVIN